MDYEKELGYIDKLIRWGKYDRAYFRCRNALERMNDDEKLNDQKDEFVSRKLLISILDIEAFMPPVEKDKVFVLYSPFVLTPNDFPPTPYEDKPFTDEPCKTDMEVLQKYIAENNRPQICEQCAKIYQFIHNTGDGVEYDDELMDVIENELTEVERNTMYELIADYDPQENQRGHRIPNGVETLQNTPLGTPIYPM